MEWVPFDNGNTIGQRGSEEGFIIRDEEYDEAARIAIERNARGIPFAITCGIYGWMAHTRYFSTELEANADYVSMKLVLAEIVNGMVKGDNTDIISKELHRFIEKFP